MATILGMRVFRDEPDRVADRERMVEQQLVRRGIRDERVLAAMRRVPRERFVPASLVANAYADQAAPVDCGQTISQPYMVARMTELLESRPGERVLEVGTGTGYQCAVLAAIGLRVFTIERLPELLAAARERLEELDLFNVSYECGDGSLGWPEHAPYDGIIVTAGAPRVPSELEDQLAVGGRLVIPIGDETGQTLVTILRTERGYKRRDDILCRFVKLIGEAAWSE